MFEELTAFLPQLQDSDYGEWIIDKENDGTPEHPIQFPFVSYDHIVRDFMDAAYSFIDAHKEMGLTHYHDILSESDIEWGSESMKNADVTLLDGRTVMALIVGAIRADRFCEGALLGFFEDGSMSKWLSRLKAIDQEECPDRFGKRD